MKKREIKKNFKNSNFKIIKEKTDKIKELNWINKELRENDVR